MLRIVIAIFYSFLIFLPNISAFLEDDFKSDSTIPKLNCELKSTKNVNYIRSFCSEIEVNDFVAIDGKLFLHEALLFGLVTSHNQMVKFYNFNPLNNTLRLIHTQPHFHTLVPLSACTVKSRMVYIAFADHDKLVGYRLERTYRGRSSEAHKYNLKYVLAVRLNGMPIAVSCSDNQVVVTYSTPEIYDVFDSQMQEMNTYEVNSSVFSNQKISHLNGSMNMLMDSFDSVALFSNNEQDNVFCYFYYNKGCVEDINSFKDANNQVNILVSDSCDLTVKHYILLENNKLELKYVYKVKGEPRSAIMNANGFVFVVTINPRKIYAYHPTQCHNQKVNYKF